MLHNIEIIFIHCRNPFNTKEKGTEKRNLSLTLMNTEIRNRNYMISENERCVDPPLGRNYPEQNGNGYET